MTKIFCDIADKKVIKKFDKKKIVKGFTTNPSLIRKAGAKNYELYCKEIAAEKKRLKAIELEKKKLKEELQVNENKHNGSLSER